MIHHIKLMVFLYFPGITLGISSIAGAQGIIKNGPYTDQRALQHVPEDLVLVPGSKYEFNDGQLQRRRSRIHPFFIGIYEETNFQYKNYLGYLKKYFPNLYQKALPNISDEDVQEYFSNPEYNYCPVTGITRDQAEKYLIWKTDRINERILIKAGIYSEKTIQKFPFNTFDYLSGKYDSIINKGKPVKNKKIAAVNLIKGYRIPSFAELSWASFPETKTIMFNNKTDTTLSVVQIKILISNKLNKYTSPVSNWADLKSKSNFFPTPKDIATSRFNEALNLHPVLSQKTNFFGICYCDSNAAEWVQPSGEDINSDNYAQGFENKLNIYNIQKDTSSRLTGFRCAMDFPDIIDTTVVFPDALLSDEVMDTTYTCSGFRDTLYEQVYKVRAQNMHYFPDNIIKYKNLQEFVTYGDDWDYDLNEIPDNFYKFTNLTSISIHNTNITGFSPRIRNLKNLRSISLYSPAPMPYPKEITELPLLKEITLSTNNTNIPVMLSVEIIHLGIWDSIKYVPENIYKMKNIKEINLRYSYAAAPNVAKFFERLVEFPKLESLIIYELVPEKLMRYICKCNNIKRLNLDNFYPVEEISDLKNLETLECQNFYIENTPENKKYFDAIANLPNLNEFISNCPSEYSEFYRRLKRVSILNIFNYFSNKKLNDYLVQISNLKNINCIRFSTDYVPSLPLGLSCRELDLRFYNINDKQDIAQFIKQASAIKTLEKISFSNLEFDSFFDNCKLFKNLKEININLQYSGYEDFISYKKRIKELQAHLPGCRVKVKF